MNQENGNSPKKPGKDSADDAPWEKVRHTGTKTEVATANDTQALAFLKKAETINPALIVIQGDLVGRVFRIPAGKTSIGRHATCQIAVSQRLVSSFHAELKRLDEGVILEDLNSTNGTLLNGALVNRPIALKSGDLIKIGNTVFKYVDKEIDAQFSEELHKQTTRDALTNAFNRAYVMRALTSSIEVAKSGYPLSIILIDLDFFKKINDNFGHVAGDYVLKESCRILHETVVRTDDILGRYGGEEFVVVMPDCGIIDAVGVAERIRKTLETHHFEFNSQKIPVTASLGVIQWHPRFQSPEEFISACDELLYKSKAGGRNRVTSSQ
jgi:diguanylate cyclase (GGDEF)-like protein